MAWFAHLWTESFFLSDRLGLAFFEAVTLVPSPSLDSEPVAALPGGTVSPSDKVSKVLFGDEFGGRCAWRDSRPLLRLTPRVFLTLLLPALGGSVLPSS